MIETPKGDIFASFSSQIKAAEAVADYVNFAAQPSDAVRTIATTRRADISDKVVGKVRAFWAKYATYSDENHIEIEPDLREYFGIASVKEPLPKKQFLTTARLYLEKARKEAIEMPSQLTEDAGRARMASVDQLIATETLFLEDARLHLGQEDFTQALSSGLRIVSKLSEMPDYFTETLRERVGAVVNKLHTASRVELVSLQTFLEIDGSSEYIKGTDPGHLGGQIKEYIRTLDDKEKELAHELRLVTLEDDTYDVTIEEGKKTFDVLSSRGLYSQAFDRDLTLEVPGKGYSIVVPLRTIWNMPEIQDAISKYRQLDRNTSNPTAYTIKVLQMIKESPDLMKTVTDELADKLPTDPTGYSRKDYKGYESQKAWEKVWVDLFRRSIDGYTLGLVEGAMEKSDMPNYDKATVMNAGIEMLWSDLDFIDSKVREMVNDQKGNPFLFKITQRAFEFLQPEDKKELQDYFWSYFHPSKKPAREAAYRELKSTLGDAERGRVEASANADEGYGKAIEKVREMKKEIEKYKFDVSWVDGYLNIIVNMQKVRPAQLDWLEVRTVSQREINTIPQILIKGEKKQALVARRDMLMQKADAAFREKGEVPPDLINQMQMAFINVQYIEQLQETVDTTFNTNCRVPTKGLNRKKAYFDRQAAPEPYGISVTETYVDQFRRTREANIKKTPPLNNWDKKFTYEDMVEKFAELDGLVKGSDRSALRKNGFVKAVNDSEYSYKELVNKFKSLFESYTRSSNLNYQAGRYAYEILPNDKDFSKWMTTDFGGTTPVNTNSLVSRRTS